MRHARGCAGQRKGLRLYEGIPPFRRKRSHRKSSSSPAPNDFGRLAANAVARGGHTVCAAMRETAGRNAPQVADMKAHARKEDVDLRAIELDVGSQPSVDRAVAATKC
jgi:hypothetical protein